MTASNEANYKVDLIHNCGIGAIGAHSIISQPVFINENFSTTLPQFWGEMHLKHFNECLLRINNRYFAPDNK